MNTKADVLFGIFGEIVIAIISFALLAVIVLIIRKTKLRSIKSKFKSDYNVNLPSDTKLDYRRCGLIKSSYGNKINYFVFKFKKEPKLIENFKSLNLKDSENPDELKVELKKYFDSVISSFELVYEDIQQDYLPNWDNEMIWNDVVPAIYYPKSMKMIVCITTE